MNKLEKKLYDDILNASNVIAKKARSGSGNFMIVNKDCAVVLDELLKEQEFKERLRQRKLKIEKIKNKLNG